MGNGTTRYLTNCDSYCCASPYLHKTVRTVLLLLYGAGLRISEALKLETADIDLQASVLWVRQSKFFKTRLVLIGPKLARVLRDYEQKRPGLSGSDGCFFRTDKDLPVSRSAME